MTGAQDNNTETAHSKYMTTYKCGAKGDEYFIDYMSRNGFTEAVTNSNSLEDAIQKLSIDMRRAFISFYRLRMANQGKPISYVSIWAYNYGESFFNPLDTIRTTQDERNSEFIRFFNLYMDTVVHE